MDAPRRSMVLLAGDAAMAARIGRLAAESGLTVVAAGEPGMVPDVAVVDIDRDDGLPTVREWRARWPEALLAGYLAIPDRDRWLAAQRAGCELVVNRGALVSQLRSRLTLLDQPRLRRFPIFAAADAPGRLGLVFRTEDTPVGPIAVWRVHGRLYAVADRCPHAGARLSDGEIETETLTCPSHGSRFDVCTGERVRGPADDGIASFRLVEEAGQIFLVLPAGTSSE